LSDFLDRYLGESEESSGLPTLRELERDYIVFLLDFTAHNVTQVSRILAISRTAVYQKINRFNIGGAN
jgi:transcriptional regulator of acetoin/glycerol metabolism